MLREKPPSALLRGKMPSASLTAGAWPPLALPPASSRGGMAGGGHPAHVSFLSPLVSTTPLKTMEVARPGATAARRHRGRSPQGLTLAVLARRCHA